MATLSVNDVLRVAIEDEYAAAGFYGALAKAIPEHGDQFGYMAVQEENHGLRLQQVLERLVERPLRSEACRWEPDEHPDLLLGARAYPSAETVVQAVAAVGGEADALRAALRLEEHSLTLYCELSGLVGPEIAATIDAIKLEERTHLADLSRLIGGMTNAGPEWLPPIEDR